MPLYSDSFECELTFQVDQFHSFEHLPDGGGCLGLVLGQEGSVFAAAVGQQFDEAADEDEPLLLDVQGGGGRAAEAGRVGSQPDGGGRARVVGVGQRVEVASCCLEKSAKKRRNSG